MACLSFGDEERAELIHWRDAQPYSKWLLENTCCTANGPFDLGVLGAQYPDLQELIFDALTHGRVKDVQTAQKLIDIAEGEYRFVFRRVNGKNTKLMYSLSDLHARHYGAFLEKDEWRLQYGTLRNTYPIAAWPQGAQEYPKYDAIATSRVRYAQERSQCRLPVSEYLVNEDAQVRAHFALHLMACWGMKTRRSEVEALIKKIDSEILLMAQPLIQSGLVKPDGKRNENEAKKRMLAILGDQCTLTKTGKEKVKRQGWTKEQAIAEGYISVDDDSASTSGDLALQAYARYGQMQLMRTKVEGLMIDSPIQTTFEVLLETGRTSSYESKNNSNSKALQNLPRYWDDMSKELAEFFGQPLPPKGSPKHPGMRGCFFPREGMVYGAADAGQAELVSLSEVCYAAFGFSEMREKINSGLDVHLDFAADMLGISYEAAKRDKAETYVDDQRQIAKCFHGDTEVLTKSGWVKLIDLKPGIEVAAASFLDGGKTKIQWEVPCRLTTRKSDELVHLFNENIDLWVTPDHRMAAWRQAEKNPLPQITDPKTGRRVAQGGRQYDKHLVHEICTPEELGKKRAWPSAGLCEEGSYNIDERLLRLAVATQADGSYRGLKISLGFTKQRKIDRMRWLLSGCEAYYTEKRVGKKQVTTFYVCDALALEIRRLLDHDKTLPWWWLNLTPVARKIVLDEAPHWDSHIVKGGRSWDFSSSIKKNADVLQAISSITDQKSTLTYSPRKELNENTAPGSYLLAVKDRANTRGGNLQTSKHRWGGAVYCLTVPSDALLVRFGGKAVICHQCGNFGFPGGSGPDSFLDFARKTYGVIMTRERAVALKKEWLRKWPEMRSYFAMVNSILNGNGRPDNYGNLRGYIQHYMSGRWRGEVAYTEACNSYFQGLTADAMKEACFEVAKACYIIKSSPMYGCRPVMFVHDEIIAEMPEAQAPYAVEEMSRIIVNTYQRYTPHTRITAEGHLMRQWNKSAKPTRNPKTNLLVPWEDRARYSETK